MKILERLALVLFSIIMIIIAVASCLVIFDVMELKSIYNFIEDLIKDETARNIILGVSIVSILLAIKALFFPTTTKKKQEIKTGVLLENKDGRLLISRDTIENLVNSVVKSFDEAIDVQTKVSLDSNSDITVYISLLVREDSIIKELSSNIQNKIKSTIKRNTDLDVTQVNINIKDIDSNKKNNHKPELKAENVKVEKNENKEEDSIQTNQNQTEENNTIDENTQENNEFNIVG